MTPPSTTRRRATGRAGAVEGQAGGQAASAGASPCRRNMTSKYQAGKPDSRLDKDSTSNLGPMCRSIKTLHNFEPPATDAEIRAAALQYVRKISGSSKPSRANEQAFLRAVDEIEEVSRRLLGELSTNAPPRDREREAAKARERRLRRELAGAAGQRP